MFSSIPYASLALFVLGACVAPAAQESWDPAGRAEPASAERLEPIEEGPPRMIDLYDPLEPQPWTSAFEKRSILVADHIRIEGPPGLITHAVVQQDGQRFRFETKTTPQGLLQRTTMKTRDRELEGIRIQLDGLSMFALQQVEVLERPERIDVSIVGRGDAWWRDPGSGEERRESELRFVGPLEAGAETGPGGTR